MNGTFPSSRTLSFFFFKFLSFAFFSFDFAEVFGGIIIFFKSRCEPAGYIGSIKKNVSHSLCYSPNNSQAFVPFAAECLSFFRACPHPRPPHPHGAWHYIFLKSRCEPVGYIGSIKKMFPQRGYCLTVATWASIHSLRSLRRPGGSPPPSDNIPAHGAWAVLKGLIYEEEVNLHVKS